MNTCDCVSSIIADWFAGIGTVGAVIFALYQNHHANKPKLNIRISNQLYWTRSYLKAGRQDILSKDKPTENPDYAIKCHRCIVINIYNASQIGIGITEKGFHFNGISFPSHSKFKNSTWIQPYRQTEFSVDVDEIEQELKEFSFHHTIKIKLYISTIDGQIKFSRNYTHTFGQSEC